MVFALFLFGCEKSGVGSSIEEMGKQVKQSNNTWKKVENDK